MHCDKPGYKVTKVQLLFDKQNPQYPELMLNAFPRPSLFFIIKQFIGKEAKILPVLIYHYQLGIPRIQTSNKIKLPITPYLRTPKQTPTPNHKLPNLTVPIGTD